MIKKLYIVQYEQNEDGFSSLTVADPNITLPNGNKKVIKILIGDYADQILKELTEAADNDNE